MRWTAPDRADSPIDLPLDRGDPTASLYIPPDPPPVAASVDDPIRWPHRDEKSLERLMAVIWNDLEPEEPTALWVRWHRERSVEDGTELPISRVSIAPVHRWTRFDPQNASAAESTWVMDSMLRASFRQVRKAVPSLAVSVLDVPRGIRPDVAAGEVRSVLVALRDTGLGPTLLLTRLHSLPDDPPDAPTIVDEGD